jgi:DNA polymerase-3 subunit epsilon
MPAVEQPCPREELAIPARSPATSLLLPPPDGAFVAIDFETADYGPESACAVGLVRVEGLKVVHRESILIRPPRPRVRFTDIHGLTWDMLKDAPPFADVWPRVAPVLDGAAFLAAHNAPFDRRVLTGCCAAAGLAVPALPFVCTVQLSRRQWGLKPNDLPSVCRRLGIGLVHHDPGSDAEACARIVIAASAAAPTLLRDC